MSPTPGTTPTATAPAPTGPQPDQMSEMGGADARIPAILAVIDEIRPALRRDGGDCEFLGLEDNRVMVRLSGACVMCRLSSATLGHIQSRIIERLGQFVRLVPVPAHPGLIMAGHV